MKQTLPLCTANNKPSVVKSHESNQEQHSLSLSLNESSDIKLKLNLTGYIFVLSIVV